MSLVVSQAWVHTGYESARKKKARGEDGRHYDLIERHSLQHPPKLDRHRRCHWQREPALQKLFVGRPRQEF